VTHDSTEALTLTRFRGFSQRIEGVTKDESDMIMKYINDIAMLNCECSVPA
jgi:hypothetical protein